MPRTELEETQDELDKLYQTHHQFAGLVEDALCDVQDALHGAQGTGEAIALRQKLVAILTPVACAISYGEGFCAAELAAMLPTPDELTAQAEREVTREK